MNSLGLSQKNHHDSDTVIDGSLTIKSGEISIPKYDEELSELNTEVLNLSTDVDILKDKTRYQGVDNVTNYSWMFRNASYVNPPPSPNTTYGTVGINFTPNQYVLSLTEISFNKELIGEHSSGWVHNVYLYETSTQNLLKQMSFQASKFSGLLDVSETLTAGKQYTIAFDVYDTDTVQYLDTNQTEFENVLIDAFVTSALNTFGFPTLSMYLPAVAFGINLNFKYHSPDFVTIGRDLYLQEKKVANIRTPYYLGDYTGQIAELESVGTRTWGWSFTCSSPNLSLRTFKAKNKFFTYFSAKTDRKITIFNSIGEIVQVSYLYIEEGLNPEDYQTIDLNYSPQEGKRYTVAIDLMYYIAPVDKENMIDKAGIESPPAVHPDMQHLIIDHGYWFSSMGYPTHQTLPVTPFYVFNIDIEQRDIMITTDKDLVCKGVHSQQYFQSFYVNSTVDLTFGDLVCFDTNISLVKSDFTMHALPVGIYYQNGLHEGQAKVLMRRFDWCL